ncbi:MAG: hypothetical protein ACE5J5_02990 [Candidatus Hydrothermarchaeales archaeon]
MAFSNWIKNSNDSEPILLAAGVILIIVGLTLIAMSFVWGYVTIGIGLIIIAARIMGYFKGNQNV